MNTQGHFPLDANPAQHMERVPFACTLGLVWEGGPGLPASVRLPFAPASRSPDHARIDTGALMAALDHVCSAAVYQALPRPSLLATIDLRCEFAAQPDAGEDVVCQATTQYLDDHFAIVRAEATGAASRRRVAYTSSTYAIGAHPGMAGKQVDALAWKPGRRSIETHDHFRTMLDLRLSDAGYTLPFDPRLVGAVSLPAVHGGATAAALVLAAIDLAGRMIQPADTWQPLSVTMHYLRAVHALPLSIRPILRKPGARSCVVGVSSFQGDDIRESVHAECLLARSTQDPRTA